MEREKEERKEARREVFFIVHLPFHVPDSGLATSYAPRASRGKCCLGGKGLRSAGRWDYREVPVGLLTNGQL